MEALLEDIDEHVEVAGSDYVAISARDVERAAKFYTRVLGFRIIERRDEAGAAHVLLGTRRDTFLALHDQRAAAAPAPGSRRLTFAVRDIERAREALWNRGVVPIRGRVPDETALRSSSELVIRDPDGHEIELLEEPYAAAHAVDGRTTRPAKDASVLDGCR